MPESANQISRLETGISFIQKILMIKFSINILKTTTFFVNSPNNPQILQNILYSNRGAIKVMAGSVSINKH